MFGDTDEVVSKKVQASLEAGLNTIVCVGENLKDREAGCQNEIVKAQLEMVFKLIDKENLNVKNKLVIAYEPIWAIGTGKVATPEQAQDVHYFIRNWASTNLSNTIAENTYILYGGSVNNSNFPLLKSQPDIDGFLVGGASLKPDFVNICQ